MVAPPRPAIPSPVRPAVGVFPQLKPGDTFKDCDVCPEMVVIPAGAFDMGSTAAERRWALDQGVDAERYALEGPSHRVEIPTPLAVGRFEVTREQFAAFAYGTGFDAGPCSVNAGPGPESGKDWRNPGFAQTGRHPVTCVNWGDAQAYLSWLSRKTGQTYRLPSESEWEYAARGGTRTMRYWGDDWSNSDACGFANVADMTAQQEYDLQWFYACDDGEAETSPVGSYPANAFGVHDALGNVWEWTEDCWNASYTGAPADGSAWTSGDCGSRVARGGSWDVIPGFVRSASRAGGQPGNRDYNNGFRVVRTLTP